jgi:creatinine amidohydrolase
MKLAEMTWPEIDVCARDVIVMVPIAAVEQHGPHLPLFTDTILCEAIVTRVETSRRSDTLLLPSQWLGASGHHLGMPGSLSAEWITHINLIIEPIRCLLRHGFRRVLVVNGHGGNIDGFHLALRQLALEFPDRLLSGISYWDGAAAEIAAALKGSRKTVGHACEFETALMMHLCPELVKYDLISDDDINPETLALKQVFVPLDMRRQTRCGCAGNPSKATDQIGRELLDVLVRSVVETIDRLRAVPLNSSADKK